MFYKEHLMIFGDLRHLTSVVNCPADIRVGRVVCDTWERNFNQNPDVGRFFRFLNLSDAEFIGTLTTTAFLFTVILFLYEFRPRLNILLFLFSLLQ